MLSMSLHIALVHFLSLSLTTYRRHSQGIITSKPLWTLSWLNRAVGSAGQSAASFSFPASLSSLIPALCQHANQSFAVVYRQEKSWSVCQDLEKPAVSWDSMEGPAVLQTCHVTSRISTSLELCKGQIPVWIRRNWKQQFLTTGLRGISIRCSSCSWSRHYLLVLGILSFCFMWCNFIFSTAQWNFKNVPEL